jgi:hypothetical protein
MLKSLAGVNRMKMNLMGRFTYNMQKGSWQFHVEVHGRSQQMKMNLMGRFTYNMQGFMAVPC